MCVNLNPFSMNTLSVLVNFNEERDIDEDDWKEKREYDHLTGK